MILIPLMIFPEGVTRHKKIRRKIKIRSRKEKVLGGGLEPPCLAAYAPQTYVSAISPPERWEARIKDGRWKLASRKFCFPLAVVLFFLFLHGPSQDSGRSRAGGRARLR